MRVLLVGNFLSSANPQVGQELAVRLSAAGATVLTTSTRRPRLARLSDMVRTTWQRRRDYDVALVEVFSGAAFLWAEGVCWTLRRARKPYALALHGGLLPDFARRWPRRVSRLLRRADRVVAPSPYLRDGLSHYGAEVLLLPNPIDLQRFTAQLDEPLRGRLVWIRAFHRLYAPELAVRVLAKLAPTFPTVELTMIGPDKGDGSLEACRALAKQLGVAERLHLPGPLPPSEVPASLRWGEVFLNTSTADNAPLSILEAMAAGRAVVSTDVGGIPHLLESGREGLLVPNGDAEALAAAVSRLLAERGLASRLGRAAQRRAAEHDWAQILPRWQTLLGELL